MTQDRKRYSSFLGARPDADVEDEIAFHLEMRAKELAARGMPIAEAREEARRRFGDRARVEAEMRRMEREKSRRATRLVLWRDWGTDLRFVLRTLWRQPVFTVAAVLTLGLSIGFNTAIVSAVDALLLRPLPVAGGDRLMAVALRLKKENITGNISYPFYRRVKALPVFEDAIAWMGWEVALRNGPNVEKAFVLAGSDNYFSALGVRPAAGRLYSPEEARARTPVVVLSHGYWQRTLNGDPSVVGRTVHVNDVPYTVIGVVPREFTGTQNLIVPDLFMPAESMAPFHPSVVREMEDGSYSSWRILARLKPGVSVAQARASGDQLNGQLEQEYPQEMRDLRLVMEREVRSRPEMSLASLVPWIAGVFFAMVGLAVLVACANVTNLLLARATARRQEIAVRGALGASRQRVVRLLLTESVLLGAMSLVVAYVLARLAIRWLNNLDIALDVPISFGLSIDWRVFAYATAISVLAGIIAGLAPAMLGARAPLSAVLREGGRSGSVGRGAARFRNGLVVAQVAVSFVLLVCGGLFMRSARSAARLDLGFQRERILLSQVDLSLHRMDSAQSRRFQDRFLQAMAAEPNVERVGLGTHLPLQGNNNGTNVYLDTRPAAAPEGVAQVWQASVSADYLPALGMRLREGRHFLPTDDETAPRVAIVNRAMAEALWPGEHVIGRRFRLEEGGPEVEVVGLIDNAYYLVLGEKYRGFAYFPLRQSPSRQTFIVTRTRTDDPVAGAGDLRRVVRGIDPNILLAGVRSMANHLDNGIALFFVNVGATLASAIGLLGLLQTIVGLYGVLSYSVAQRTREFGIRQALGARTGTIISQVLRQGSLLCGTGLLVGAVLAVLLTRGLASLLYGVSPTDALVFGVAILVIGSVALLASYVPAWRAARVTPAVAIRNE